MQACKKASFIKYGTYYPGYACRTSSELHINKYTSSELLYIQ
jgi:hypothetical protein